MVSRERLKCEVKRLGPVTDNILNGKRATVIRDKSRTETMKNLLRTIAAVAYLIAIIATSTVAQTVPLPKLRSLVVSNGIITAENETTRVNGTVGQSVVGPSSKPQLNGLLGFWSVVLPNAITIQIDNEIFFGSIAPNPVSQEGVVTLILKRDGHVQMGLYDKLGRQEIEIESGWRAAGRYAIPLNTQELIPGMRFLVVSFNSRQISIPVLVMR